MTYDTEFYENIRSGSRASAHVVVPLVLDMLPVDSVLDVGCGVGSWLAVFASHGVANVFGVDWDVPVEALEIDSTCYRAIDLATPFALGKRFDLVVSLEVAEHLPASAADDFVANLVHHGEAILFSAAVPGQGGTHHVNEQWLSSWVERFDAHGFTLFDLVRGRCWDNPHVAWWYRQNIVLFARGGSAGRLVGLPTPSMPVDVVHPARFSQPQTPEGARVLLAALPPALRRAALARLAKGARALTARQARSRT